MTLSVYNKPCKMLTYLLCVIAFLCLLHVSFNYNHRARLFKKIPGPNGVFIIGNAWELLLSPAEFFDYLRSLGKKWSPINKLWVFPYSAVHIYRPEDIELVISTTKNNKKSLFYTFLELWLQDGLLISYGKKWQERRKILTPTFHFTILKEFCAIFQDNSRRLVTSLKKLENKSVDVIPIVSEFTLHTICETAMGIQLNSEEKTSRQAYINALSGIGDAFARRCSKVYLYPNWTYLFSPIKRQEIKNANIIHNFTKSVIHAKRNLLTDAHPVEKMENCENVSYSNSCKKRMAMLDLLLSAERDGLIDGKGIQEEVDTFMFEGHDTTAWGLIYCLMLLANNKHVQDKILEELNEIFRDSKREATETDLSKMRYLDRCIKESLRLYPSVPTIGRILKEDTQLCGYKIPAGSQCLIPIYDLHRREELYKDPLKFNPDRFLPENCIKRHPFAYLPFSAGPRNCIGQKFAMLAMKSSISAVLREFELQPITTPEDLKFATDLILKSIVPVKVIFVPRNTNKDA